MVELTAPGRTEPLSEHQWRHQVISAVHSGQRFGGLYGTSVEGGVEVTALLATTGGVERVHTLITPNSEGELTYRSLTDQISAAFWYERALHDLSGVVPQGHPRLDPLLLPLADGVDRPRPGLDTDSPLRVEERTGPVDVAGHGLFTLPFGPVRSGVMESIELLLETPGEDIPHLNIRPHYKHRGIAKQFEGRSVADGVLIAERVEGISTVAHALAYCHAVETLTQTRVPTTAALIRVIYAELERIINHLDVTMRLCDASGLAVATARFGLHKETLMRLVSQMGGSRFARTVIVPGGVAGMPHVEPGDIDRQVRTVRDKIRSDISALESSASFLDRLRRTGPLTHERAREHGALGPIGRASGFDDDDRRHRPYDGYPLLGPAAEPDFDAGDAMARARLRWHEIDSSAALIHEALTQLGGADADLSLRGQVEPADGFAAGWAEAAQGEVLYGLELRAGRIRRCFARSASLHNMVLFHDVFVGDIFTDLPFIEASFGLSYAGVAM